ncbi:MAG TPA: helix-turn-helix domain-containing protein [Candidatus Krumholzibacteria bacterium]|nr:helix-turn-helix domain-containing protein [Candidatus Krumholzibacteria bacterium]
MSIEKSLESLGLTQIEALAYTYLVANPSSTGYRVARGIGKPTANTYRALESLSRKGAVLQDRGATPSFRALTPDDLLARLEHDFMKRKKAAAEKLASLQPDEGDERIYALTSPDQVLTRARIVLASARKLVLIDTVTTHAIAFENEIAEARSRRIRVLLREGVRSPGALPSLRMVVDAREVLLAAFDHDETRMREAFWTRSAFLARSMHDAIASELCCARIEAMMAEGLSVDEVEAVMEEWRETRRMV